MIITPEFLHYSAACLGLSLGAIGAGIGLGIAGLGVEESMTRQPTGNNQSFRAIIVGLAFIEGGAVIALVTTLLALMGRHEIITYELGFAELGMGLAIGLATASTCIASSFVVKAACHSIARQPLFGQKILTFMLITQSIIEAPVIFAFVVSLIIKSHLSPFMTMADSLRFFAGGLCIALGCIGPSIGQGIFGAAATTAIGINKKMYNRIFTYALSCEALIETPMIFSLLSSLLILSAPSTNLSMFRAIKFLVAAITIGLGSLGSAIGMGYAGSKGCTPIAVEPQAYPPVIRSTLVAFAFIESIAVYALIITLLLIV